MLAGGGGADVGLRLVERRRRQLGGLGHRGVAEHLVAEPGPRAQLVAGRVEQVGQPQHPVVLVGEVGRLDRGQRHPPGLLGRPAGREPGGSSLIAVTSASTGASSGRQVGGLDRPDHHAVHVTDLARPEGVPAVGEQRPRDDADHGRLARRRRWRRAPGAGPGPRGTGRRAAPPPAGRPGGRGRRRTDAGVLRGEHREQVAATAADRLGGGVRELEGDLDVTPGPRRRGRRGRRAARRRGPARRPTGRPGTRPARRRCRRPWRGSPPPRRCAGARTWRGCRPRSRRCRGRWSAWRAGRPRRAARRRCRRRRAGRAARASRPGRAGRPGRRRTPRPHRTRGSHRAGRRAGSRRTGSTRSKGRGAPPARSATSRSSARVRVTRRGSASSRPVGGGGGVLRSMVASQPRELDGEPVLVARRRGVNAGEEAVLVGGLAAYAVGVVVGGQPGQPLPGVGGEGLGAALDGRRSAP